MLLLLSDIPVSNFLLLFNVCYCLMLLLLPAISVTVLCLCYCLMSLLLSDVSVSAWCLYYCMMCLLLLDVAAFA